MICDSRVMVLASGWIPLSVPLWPTGLLPNCSWGKDFQFWAAASPCCHTFNKYNIIRSWEWVIAAAVLPSVNSWRAFWQWCSFCFVFSTLKKQWVDDSAWLWVFAPYGPSSEDPPCFLPFFQSSMEDLFWLLGKKPSRCKQKLLFLLWSWLQR